MIRHGRENMVVRFITNYASSGYHHQGCEFESRSWRGVLDTTLCDKVRQVFPVHRVVIYQERLKLI